MSAPRDFLFMGEQPEQFGRERVYDGTDALRAEVETLRAQKLELLAALVPFTDRHASYCLADHGKKGPCTCGVGPARTTIKNVGGES